MLTLVTGAAGFIGTHLTRTLRDSGDEVVEVDRATGTDLLKASLTALLDGVEVVYHLAGQPGVRDSFGRGLERYLADNVLATELLLEAAEQVGVRRVVFASSSSVYGSMETPANEYQAAAPASPYGVSKLACEHLCRISPVETVALRYFTVYGPGQRPDMAFSRFIAAAQAGEPLSVYGDGTQIRDFTYVADAVAATIAAGHCGSGVYNIAGGSQVSLNEAITTLAWLLGRPLEVQHTEVATGDVHRTYADTTRARADLGYSPSVALEEGLRRQLRA